jgi:exonuclease III
MDVVALQEIGDPALLSTHLPPYLLAYSAGPSHHQAGVGLLLSLSLAPRIRSYRRSRSGRLMGAVLELRKGHQLLLVSAYMPSGLDHKAASSPEAEQAHRLYDEILQWSVGMQQVIVMGDLNETLTPHDRFPLPPPSSTSASSSSSPIHCLPQQGFTDVWRCLHPSAALHPGFTHHIEGVRTVRSRLDYIWCKGGSRSSFLRIHIDGALRALSHHRLLWMDMQLPSAAAYLIAYL